MKNRLLFLGPPGAGKGTQAEIVSKKFNLLHLSTGDLLRNEVSKKTDLGLEAEKIMNKGELVSDSIVLSIVKKNLVQKNQGWLLDGFPRNLDQAKLLNLILDDIKQVIDSVVFIDIEEDLLVTRLIKRGRDDDTEEVIRNRLSLYKSKTQPLVKFYSKLNLLSKIDGNGEIDVVSKRIVEVLK